MYKVEKIIGKRQSTKKKGTIEYLVKWEGWDVKDSTWEPQKHLQYVLDLVQEYQRDIEQKNMTKSESSQLKSLSSVLMVDDSQSSSIKKATRIKPSSIRKKQSYLLNYQDKCNSILRSQKSVDSNASIAGSETRKKQRRNTKKLPNEKIGVNQETTENQLISSDLNQKKTQTNGNKKQIKTIKILGMKKEGSQFWYYVVQGNGKQSWVVRDYMIEHYASDLCKFYEDRIVFSS